MRKLSGAVAGNKVHAWRTEKRIDGIFNAVKWDKDRTLFITLTKKYVKTEKGRKESWESFRRELPKLLRKLKTKGLTAYIAVKEAHAEGGCHVHLLAQFTRNFLFFTHKGKRRIANKSVRDFIKDNWAGDIDIEGLRNDDIRGYMKKYLGKFSHCEDAMRRARRDWEQEGDLRHKDADCKKLWTNYYCSKLKERRFSSSEKICRTGLTAKPSDLVKDMNNSTADNKPKIKRMWRLPYHKLKQTPLSSLITGVWRKTAGKMTC